MSNEKVIPQLPLALLREAMAKCDAASERVERVKLSIALDFGLRPGDTYDLGTGAVQGEFVVVDPNRSIGITATKDKEPSQGA